MKNKEKNIYMGCGPDKREGFIHCDLRQLDHVDIVCKAWELSSQMMEVDHIYSRHMLEHLTNYEADRALRDWFKSLKTNGTIQLIISDMDFFCKQWLEAEWTEEMLKDKTSNAKQSFAAIWGSQAECDPWSKDYNTNYWDVQKSGYNQKRIKILLERIGFVNVNILIRSEGYLVVTANKPKYSGERQVGTTLEEIRKDHLNRYIFASSYIMKANAIVSDGACGVGYGSYVLAQNQNTKIIQSLDISNDALSHAKQYFNHKKIEYRRKDLENETLDDLQKADYFISFETIEHLPNPEKYIAKIADALNEDGLFIGSTPNEEIMPFNQQKFLYHTRHFTQNDLVKILKHYGFKKIKFFQQMKPDPSNIEKINYGHYIIFIASKKKF